MIIRIFVDNTKRHGKYTAQNDIITRKAARNLLFSELPRDTRNEHAEQNPDGE